MASGLLNGGAAVSDVLLHAIVLADGPNAGRKVAGLTLRERGRRVAARVGAVRVLMIDRPEDRATIAGWWREGIGGELLVIRAHDQLVHTPLVNGLPGTGRSVAITPEGAPAGALLGGAELAEALAAGADDLALAQEWLAGGVRGVTHGTIARHPVTSPAERRAAEKHLFKIVHKPQDNWLTRYLFRPISGPLTKLAVKTPITPNQVTYLTAVMVAIGVWLTIDHPVLGALTIVAASYVDCVDGEVARLKLMSSKLGGWLDTIVDEASTVAQLAALGWHCHLWWNRAEGSHLSWSMDGWVIALAVGLVASLVSIYCIYYNIIVLMGSANSQDYCARFEVVPGDEPGTVKMRPVPPAPVRQRHVILHWIGRIFPYVIRRDFLVWAIVLLAALELTHLAFGTIVLGSVITAFIVCLDHLRIRRQRRDLIRSGLTLVRA